MAAKDSQLSRLRMDASLSEPQCCRLFQISARTWRRWKACARIPEFVTQLLRLKAGHLGNINQAWHGYRIINAELYAPGWRDPIELGEINTIPLQRSARRIRDLEIRELRAERDALLLQKKPCTDPRTIIIFDANQHKEVTRIHLAPGYVATVEVGEDLTTTRKFNP